MCGCDASAPWIVAASHPWFVAVQCHPEFKSKPTAAHPLFRGFVEAALRRREAKKAEAARVRSQPPLAPYGPPPRPSRSPLRG
jgi:CTP synthase